MACAPFCRRRVGEQWDALRRSHLQRRRRQRYLRRRRRQRHLRRRRPRHPLWRRRQRLLRRRPRHLQPRLRGVWPVTRTSLTLRAVHVDDGSANRATLIARPAAAGNTKELGAPNAGPGIGRRAAPGDPCCPVGPLERALAPSQPMTTMCGAFRLPRQSDGRGAPSSGPRHA